MSHADNKTVMLNIFDLMAKGDTQNVDKYFATNWVNHDPSLPLLNGLEGAKQVISLWQKSFSNLKIAIDDSVTQGELVAMRFAISGTHIGTFMGIAPTGKRINVTATGIFKVVGGKSTDNWVNFDALGLLQQLGATSIPKR